ncbi:unnamed protein product [Meganyctiphanes norvegica]|uniref:Uncharacterized protein n=1 Tax=Meganyctiphanes norvegica TaxID=48144 RepID=A0AAV2Q7R3_MEGNR
MPLRIQPSSLQQSCMYTIGKNFALICYGAREKKQMSAMIMNDSYKAVEGPFKQMPGSLLSSIISFYMQNNLSDRRWHLHLLIQPQLNCIKLSHHDDVLSALKMLITRCKSLTHLDLGFLNNVDPAILMQLVPTLRNIQVLKLNHSIILDQACDEIGKHCPHIVELDISHTYITDNGLQVFDCAGEWGLTMDDVYGNKTKKLQLRVLNSTNNYISPESFDVAVTLCPYIQNVTLSNAYIENELLYKIMAFDNLCHLRLTNSDNLTLDFQEGVLPILLIKGHQLLTLLLVKFISIDIRVIGECCPCLENLALDMIGCYEEIMYPRENLFTQLKALEIWTDITVDTLNGVILKQILSYSQDIRTLLVSSSVHFNDNILFDIWMDNPMRKLARITLDKCPNISGALLNCLLDMENDLTLIRARNCSCITRDNKINLKKRIKDENCDCYFEWYNYEG